MYLFFFCIILTYDSCEFIEKIRQSMINLISEAYSSILIDEFVKYIGLPKENALSS
jgi:hypothetical protein